MTSAAGRAVTDPLGLVTELISQVEPGLEPNVISGVVIAVAPGRNVRRSLAQALVERPALLTDGRSPAPRVVGSLLIALRRAGAVRVSAPVCATCGKLLGSLQRRGPDWYCGVCGPRLEPCAGCGKTRRIARRDRAGQPLCHSCRPDDSAETMQILHRVITAIDPELAEQAVVTAVQAVARTGQRHHLAWTLGERPEFAHRRGRRGAHTCGAAADRGAPAGRCGIVRPPCPRCGRVMTLSKILDGVRVCRTCLAKSRAQTCSRCGVYREPATRDEDGRPLCPHCLSTDPVNQETCSGCGRRRPVSVRTGEGPLCPSCRPAPTMVCSICTRSAPAVISKLTGKPGCRACLQRRARCTGCGAVRPIRGGTLTEPLCATCARPDASWHACPGCGEHTQLRLRLRRCGRCSLRQRLNVLLSGDTGQIHPKLQALHDSLAHHDRPDTVLSWLNKDTVSAILRELAAGQRPLTHAALDELPDGKPLRHLRSVLVAVGTLPPRDEHLFRLECWIAWVIGERPDPGQQQPLHRYAVWHVLRRLRGRLHGGHATYGQLVAARRNITAAIALLDWLTSNDLTLATARQGDLEAWLVRAGQTSRTDAGNFVRWANRQKLTPLEFAALRWRGPTGVIDTETRWEQARRLLHDGTLKPEDRVAGLLVLLYAQTAATISRLTLDHVQTSDTEVRLRLGREPVILPEPVDALVLQLVATRRGHATLGDQGTSPWLFPGGQPGRPISASRLAERLRELGIHAGPSRSTALFQLATDLPAAVLARMLGIHISVATAWQRAAAGDWTHYAAELSRRNHR